MNRKKYVMISFMVLLIFLCGSTTSNADTVADGKCGDNVRWTITDDHTITISGTGAMDDYEMDRGWEYLSTEAPWYSYYSFIHKVVILPGVTKVGARAFQSYPIDSIVLPNTVREIGSYAFSRTNIQSVDIPEGVEEVDAFWWCENLKEVKLPSTIKRIGGFGNCDRLERINIPEGVEIIEDGAFEGCGFLEGITIPASVTYIGSSAFAYCHAIRDLTILNNKVQIGDDAFKYCTGIDNISISESLLTPELISRAFKNTLIYIREFGDVSGSIDNAIYTLDENGLLTITGDGILENTYFEYYECVRKVLVKGHFSTINSGAFSGLYAANEIEILSGERLSSNAFNNCRGLKKIIIGDQMESIDRGAFNITKYDGSECDSLKTIVFKGSIDKWLSFDVSSSIPDGVEVICEINEHAWNTNYTTDKEATYTEEGLESIHCSACNQIKEGSQRVIPVLEKSENTMTVKKTTQTIKARNIVKKALSVRPITVSNAKGKVVYKVVGGNTKSKNALKINTKTGKITVKKGTKKGIYKVQVKITASGTNKGFPQYKGTSKIVWATVKVK